MNAMREFFSSNDFMPHGFCYLWNPRLIWLHAVSDIVISISYFCIPFALLYLVRKKRSLPFDWIIVCFGIFIAACGATHFMEVLTLWIPAYWISGGVKAFTALASLPTAILLTRVVPQILNLPSSEDLRAANQELSRREAILRDQASLLDLSQDAILVQTMDGRNLLWNQGAERMYGWAKAEAKGCFTHELLHTTFPIPREEILGKLAATGYWEGELRQKRRDGGAITVSSQWVLGPSSGARGYVLKSDVAMHLVRAVKDVAQGKVSLTPKVSEIVLEGFLKSGTQTARPPLRTSPSPRETEIIRLLAAGKSNKEVAAELGITARTVETHRARIMLKMGFHSLTDLVHYAIRSKIATPLDA